MARLATIFREEGFQDVVEDRRREDASQLPFWYDVTILAMEEMAGNLADGGPEVREMIQKAIREREENGRGVAIVSDRVTCVGMKAMESDV